MKNNHAWTLLAASLVCSCHGPDKPESMWLFANFSWLLLTILIACARFSYSGASQQKAAE
jgi:hypothetical protein